MARHGVDYETVKHASIKLLSQGTAPSVQKLREMLGTGSNTTLANHLKSWREECATKEVHHLPANMPKALIAAIEVLWQTALEQAQNQLVTYKQSLEDEKKKISSAQAETEKHNVLLQVRINTLHEKHEAIVSQYQQLQTDYAILDERTQKKEDAYIAAEKQQKAVSQQNYKEKDELTIQIRLLQADLKKAQEKSNEESKAHQNQLKEQRLFQEQSENRWHQLIEHARQESKAIQKEFKIYKESCTKDIKQIRNKLTATQQQLFEKIAQYNASSIFAEKLQTELSLLRAQHVTLQSKLITQKSSSKSKKRLKKAKSLAD